MRREGTCNTKSGCLHLVDEAEEDEDGTEKGHREVNVDLGRGRLPDLPGTKVQ